LKLVCCCLPLELLAKSAYCYKTHPLKSLQQVVQNEEHQASQHFLYQGLKVDLLMQWELRLVLEGQKELDLKHLVATEEMAMKPIHSYSRLVGLVVLEHLVAWAEVLPEVHLKVLAKDFDLQAHPYAAVAADLSAFQET
jgi:hypothetical protein